MAKSSITFMIDAPFMRIMPCALEHVVLFFFQCILSVHKNKQFNEYMRPERSSRRRNNRLSKSSPNHSTKGVAGQGFFSEVAYPPRHRLVREPVATGFSSRRPAPSVRRVRRQRNMPRRLRSYAGPRKRTDGRGRRRAFSPINTDGVATSCISLR